MTRWLSRACRRALETAGIISISFHPHRRIIIIFEMMRCPVSSASSYIDQVQVHPVCLFCLCIVPFKMAEPPWTFMAWIRCQQTFRYRRRNPTSATFPGLLSARYWDNADTGPTGKWSSKFISGRQTPSTKFVNSLWHVSVIPDTT